jgi:DNA replication protein DnaC
MYQLMAWSSRNVYGKSLIVKDDKRGLDFSKLITVLCFFVSKDERFEKELGYSFDKGLWIRGISGLGKTHLVKCISENGLNPILVISMLEIEESIRLNGHYSINPKNHKIIYIDDVGTEEATVKNYGSNINFFKNFIEGTYLRSKTFEHLIISTNNSFSEIEQKYGFRVRSRIKDMFNIVDIVGKDIRGL